MKVPDLPEVVKSTSVKKHKNVDLGKLKKNKKRITGILKFAVVILAAAALLFVWLNAETIFEPFRGIASKIETKTSYNIGFPIELPGSSDYSLKRFGDCFSLLTDTYLYAYNTSGEQLYALKHGYSNAEQTTNNKRILLFDKAGYSFAIYNKTSLIYEKQVDEKIIYTSIGEDGLAAVVTESARYSNILHIYDDGGNWKYTKKFADENVMQVCSSGDGEHIIISTLSASNGDIVTNIYKFSIKDAQGYIWKYSVRSNSLPCGMYADKDNVTLICDNSVIALNCEDGTLKGNYLFSGKLRHFYTDGKNTLLQYTDISSNRNVLLSLDENVEGTALVNVTVNASCVYADEDGIYVLDGTKIKVYDTDLMNERDIPTPDDDFSSFVKIRNSVFLLGYGTLDTTEITE